jgi:uroporphyrinogen-III synthase
MAATDPITGKGLRPLVVVTRPEPQCGRWVLLLREAGFAAVGLPLLRIAPVHEGVLVASEVERWLADATQGYRAVMLVSSAAVEGLWKALGDDRAKQLVSSTQSGVRFWVTGPSSAKTLMSHGVDANCIDQPDADGSNAQFDSQALWTQVACGVNADAKVLIVRGAGGGQTGGANSWLEVQLRERACTVTVVEAYQRLAPLWDPDQRQLAQQALGAPSVWLLTSVEGMGYLPRYDWTAQTALVTHPRQREAALKLGFQEARLCDPRLEQVIASLKSLQ